MKLHGLMEDLMPLRRSLTGDGVRESLRRIQREIPIEIHEVPSGTKCFDWIIPDEWRFRSARLFDEAGGLVLDADWNFLHVVGYSEPVKRWMDLEDLKPHLHTLPEQPDLIPYCTTYYRRDWGFCMTHQQYQSLKPGKYLAKIEAEHFQGSLTYGDLLVRGESEREVMLWTYVDHPNMCVNELSGPVTLAALAEWILTEPRRLTYRIVFGIETIGALVYLSRHLEHLQEHAAAVFVLTCLGGEGEFSLQLAREPNYASDIAEHVLKHQGWSYELSPWAKRGSDERQFGAPNISLPVCSVRKTEPGSPGFEVYHTSGDNLEFCTEEQLWESVSVYRGIVEAIEADETFVSVMLGEPMMSRRNRYPTLSKRGSTVSVREMMTVISHCDGKTSALEIAERMGVPIWEVAKHLGLLKAEGLLAKAVRPHRPGGGLS